MEPDRIWQVVTNPAWRPITDNDTPGYVLLLGAADAMVEELLPPVRRRGV